MPVWLRKFTFSEIQTYYEDERKAYDKAKDGKGKQTLVTPDGKINAPEFTKASKQYKQAENNLSKFKGKTGCKQ